MKLRSRRGFMAEKLEEMLEGKTFSDDKLILQKENALNKKYLRTQNRSDSKIKPSNQNLKKISGRSNKSTSKVPNSAVQLDCEGKENKMKKRPKRTTSQNCLKVKSCSSSRTILLEKNTCIQENRKKITLIMNVNNNLVGRKHITHKRNIKSKNLNNEVPLCEISNNHSVSDKKNEFINQIEVKSQGIINYTEKLPIWRKKAILNKTKCGIKRKGTVDVYDISQDEDMSNEAKHKKRKVNPRKIVKKPVNKNKGFINSNKITNSNQKYPNPLKPVHNRLNKLAVNDQSKDNGSNPPSEKVTTTAVLSDNRLEITPPYDILPNEYFDNSSQNCIILVEDSDVTSEDVESDLTYKNKKEQIVKKFLLNLADELENSLTLPRMTSTPDSTLLNDPMTKHLPSSKLRGLNISSIIPKSKNCFKGPANVCTSFSDTVTDITLFESPVKKPQKKDPVKLKSPKKNIQIDLFKNTVKSKIDDLENSVLEPKKAYHSPDNFKTHLVQTKRISEVIKRNTVKTKEEKMIEKLAQHFEEISSTELTIE